MTDSPARTFRASQKCPLCGEPLRDIVYGYPDHELFEAAERGEVALGGCVIEFDDPTHTCPAGHRWGRRGRPGSG